MAEVGDKLVNLEDLKSLSDNMTTKLDGKLAVPLNDGTQGQVLTAKGDGTNEWKDAHGGLSINKEGILVDQENMPVQLFVMEMPLTSDGAAMFGVSAQEFSHGIQDISEYAIRESSLLFNAEDITACLEIENSYTDRATSHKTDSASCRIFLEYLSGEAYLELRQFANGPRSTSDEQFVKLGFIGHEQRGTLSSSNPVRVNIDGHFVGQIGPFNTLDQVAGLIAPDNVTTVVQNDDGVLSVKDNGITMAKLAKDVKDAIAGNAPAVSEATVRRIVNEQLAKMKFTINDQGHLIIETPEA